MESSAAGTADLAPPLADDLRRLSALRPGCPVLSLYIDINPTGFATQPARDSALTSALDEARKRVEEYETDHDGKVSLRRDLERTNAFLEQSGPKHGSGLALYAASHSDLFEADTLSRAPRARVVIDDSPYVTPLFAAADKRDWLIVVVDARDARFLHGNPGHVEELEHAREHIAGQRERQSTSDHQLEDAIGQSAEVLPLRHLGDELDEQTRIAAVLRF